MNHTVSKIAVLALATRRVTTLVTEDSLTEGIRKAVVAKFPPSDHKLGYLVNCPRCVSVWAGVGLGLLESTNSRVVRAVVTGLALSEASIMLDRYAHREFDF